MGLRAVHKMGGTVIVQDAATWELSGMPAAAIGTGTADFILPPDAIADALSALVAGRSDA
jgi:two-component system chemotaxis response regulator CheB